MSAPLGSPPASARWLYGPASDLAFGCGGLYLLYFAAYAATGPAFERVFPAGLLPLGALVLGTPHYGATLLRVYERSVDRRAYRVFAIHASVLIAALFTIGVYNVTVGSLLLTLYLSWSPWHYSGQNYGIAVMFLRRRGVPVSSSSRRLLQLSFLLSWVLVLVAIHVEQPQAAYAPVTLAGSAYVAIPLGIPTAVAAPLLVAATIAYLAVVVAGIVSLRTRGSWRDLVPTLALMALQALWFSIPVLSRSTLIFSDVAPLDPYKQTDTFHWIAFGHFTQYLWIATYYAREAQGPGGTTKNAGKTRYYLKALMAGALVWGVPSLLFAPDALGVRPFDAGLAALVASAVNIHHFVLDGAIWKLRDGRIARILIRRDPAAPAREDLVPPRRVPGLRPVVFATAAAWLVISAVGTLEVEYGFRRAALNGDVERLERAATRLRLVGRDSPGVRAQLALFAEAAGDYEKGIREIQRSLALAPSAEGWVILGRLHARSGHRARALAAYGKALQLDPANRDARRGTARLSGRSR